MREDSFSVDKSFILGLIPDEKYKRNAVGLVEAYNCKISKQGIEEYTALTNPFTGLPACTWPYPQVFDLLDGIYVTTETGIYKANSSYVCVAMITGLPAGDLWEVADFYSYQIWSNGTVTVVRDAETGVFSTYPMTHPMGTIIDYNGQFIAANLGDDKENWIAWGNIGRVYLDRLLDHEDRSNTSGFMPMGFRGDIHRIKKLGEKIMVYGSQGIGALKPGSVKPYKTMPQFGREDLFPFGVAGKGCVAGDENLHVFIDNFGYLHAIDKAGTHNRLGYSNYIANLENEIVIHHDKLKNEYYIGDGDRAYLFSGGLSETFQSASGILRQGAVLYGVTYDGSDTTAYVTTNSFNVHTDSIKTAETVEIMATGTNLQGAIDYRFQPNETFTRGMVKNVSRHGTFKPIISGVDLRLHIRASTYVDFSVDSAIVRFKLSDKRTIRGPYAQPTDL